MKRYIYIFVIVACVIFVVSEEYLYDLNNYFIRVYKPETDIQRRAHYNLMDREHQELFRGAWNMLEPHGRWLSSKTGYINLPPLLNEEYILQISLSSLLSPGKRGRVKFYFNDDLLDEISVSSDIQYLEYIIDRDLIKNDNTFKIKTNFSNIPREIFANSFDIRSLSVHIHSLYLNSSMKNTLSYPSEDELLTDKINLYFRVFSGQDDEIIIHGGQTGEKVLDFTFEAGELSKKIEYVLEEEINSLKIPEKFWNSPLQVTITAKEDQAGIQIPDMEYIYRPQRDEPDISFPQIFPYYYPWYKEKHRIYFTTQPLYDDYDFSEEQVKWEIKEALNYGIDGFCMEYYGVKGDERYWTVLNEAAQQDFSILLFMDGLTIYHRAAPDLFEETERFARPLPIYIEKLIPYIEQTVDTINYFAHPAYHFIDNRPAIYLYAVGTNWDLDGNVDFLNRILRYLYGINAFYIGDFGATREEQIERVAHFFDAITYYTPIDTYKLAFDPDYNTDDMKALNRVLHEKLAPFAPQERRFYPVLCSGYDDHLINPDWFHPGVSENLFSATFYQALEHDPEIIFIATWNELMEGNGIIPSHEHGYTFLELLENLKQEAGYAP